MEFICNICPRKCGALRTDAHGDGYCCMGSLPVVARAGLHMWEEPCISGTNGSGTVFFSGCSLGCIYCQNHRISLERFGVPVSEVRLKDIFSELVDKGAHNINLVNPTHFSHVIIKALDTPLSVPVVWNSGGYDSVETLKALEGKVQIYLPDLKYLDSSLSELYSDAADYPSVAAAAISEMFRQRGKYIISDDGIMKSGVIIRHLILPDHIENTYRVIDWVESNFEKGDVMFSLMSQYTPAGDVGKFKNLQRRLTENEYSRVFRYLQESDIEDGFFQELSSAKEEFIPDFDLTGI